MSDPTNLEVTLWLQGKFGTKQRGLVTQAQADGYNRAHPDRPYTGPVRDTSALRSRRRGCPDAVPFVTERQRRIITAAS